MISWIQRNFQQHFKIVFALVLIGTIVSFVISFGPGSGIGRGDRVVVREFFGHKLDGANPAAEDFNDARVSIQLQLGGASGLTADDISKYALQRIAGLHLADELHLPPTTPAEETEFIKTLRLFTGTNGQFDPQRYSLFRQNIKDSTSGISQDDIVRVITDDARIAKVQNLLNGPGYVLPHDVQEQITRSDTSWTIGTATVDYANFKPAISPTGADLDKFFQQNSFRYDVPPTVVAGYVDFPASAYIGGVTLTDAEVRAYYDANPARFPAPAKAKGAAKPVKLDPAADFMAVRPAVEAALRLERAKNLAVRAASDFAYSLYDDKVPAGAGLDSYLAARKLTLKPLAPFSHDAGPAELGGSPDIADAAFKLNADRYYSEGLPTPSGAAILIWKETRPAHVPFLVDVRAKVQADFIENERRERFVELGRTLHSQILDRIKRGATFEKAAAGAAAASDVKIEIKTLPPFTLETRPKDLNETVGGALSHMDKGQLSDMAITAEKGYLVYVADKQAPRFNEGDPRFAAVRAQLAAYSARTGAGAYLSQIVDQELKRSEPVLK